MAPAKKKNGKGSTPGRPKKKETQYWDVGKVGRKTGITLEDKGIRDEHGLEPVSHIFSSPISPQRRGDGTLTSSEMNVQDINSTALTVPSSGSAPSVDKTLHMRKTPRLPPPRQSTPKHTNIGSPKRMSTGRPISQRLSVGLDQNGSPSRSVAQPPNRILDFGENRVHKSIESPSPFKPKHVLRRSVGLAQQNPFASPVPTSRTIVEEQDDDAKAGAEDLLPEDDGPILQDDDDYHDAKPYIPEEESEPVETSPTSRKAARRISGESSKNSQIETTLPVAQSSSGQKRNRSTLEDEVESEDVSVSQSQIGGTGRASKKQRGKEKVVVHHDDGPEVVDPSLLAYGDEFEPAGQLDDAPEPEPEMGPEPQPAKGKGKGKGKKGKAPAPKERDPNRAMRATGSVPINDSPSKLRNAREGSRGSSVGPIPNYHLRATTPFEDAGERTSRYGRNLIQPLKYWANETRIYKHGEVEGIVRAEEVEKPQRKKPKKRSRKTKSSKLDGIDEESDTGSVAPDEWEDEVGVIAGLVANWDPVAQSGMPEDLVREDLAFASSSIITRDVAGSDFKYSKIMTLPFFGSGIVELPPQGYKRAKNSRKMQMCFFVHEGKVEVEVGAAGKEETNVFAVSKGGVWVVPRGNNYAITNTSQTRTAHVFFAQGCEVEAVIPEEGQTQ